MRIFSCLRAFVFLGVTLLLVVGTADSQERNLEVLGENPTVVKVGDAVEAIFLATIDGAPAAGIQLTIWHSEGIGDITIGNGGRTNFAGLVIVEGTIQSAALTESSTYIGVKWGGEGLSAQMAFNVQKPNLKIIGADPEVVYEVGDTVEAVFLATIDDVPAAGVQLTVNHSAGIGDITVSRGGRTDAFGRVTIRGTIQLKALTESSAYIRVGWTEMVVTTQVNYNVVETIKNADTLIVVNPRNPKSVVVGDTFTQRISIENGDEDYSTLPLSAWRMDVMFNSSVLEVLDVTEGDFLTGGGTVNTRYHVDISPGKISVSQVRTGSLPGIALDPADKGTLLTITFKVLEFAEEALGLHNVRLQSSEDRNRDGTPDRISYSIVVKDVFVATNLFPPEDVNRDGTVNILDMIVVANSIGSDDRRADVNGDGFVNVLDLVSIYASDLWAKPAPAKVVESSQRDDNEFILVLPTSDDNIDLAAIQTWIDLAKTKSDGTAVFDLGIANLETLLASRIPSKTELLSNYPNPFNPETWIPYRLSESGNVTVSIYAVNGALVRTLALGHQVAGVYQSKGRAAYWDGRNDFGERVASGIYFYTFTAGDFSATRKMLIRK